MRRQSLIELNAREAIANAARGLLSGRVEVLAGAALISGYVEAIPDWSHNAALVTIYNVSDDAERYVFGERLQDWHETVRERKRQEGLSFLERVTPEVLHAARELVENPLRPA